MRIHSRKKILQSKPNGIWFAWHPVWTKSDTLVWLEQVYRKSELVDLCCEMGVYDSKWKWAYSLPEECEDDKGKV